MSIFGFPPEAPGGGADIVPIVKYDARAGRLFRMDRVQTSTGFTSEQVDITGNFKALCDFENIEVGWFNFTPGVAPSIIVVKRGAMLPPKPSEQHKYGLQFMLKLAKECGGAEPIRKISGTSKAFRNAFEHIVGVWDNEHKTQGGKLPVLMLDGLPMPVTTGQGQRQSTNYHPKFKIVGWAPRGDLKYVEQPQAAATQTPQTVQPQTNGAAPVTGAQRAPAPAPAQSNVAADFSSDFG
jgi:hypothetical protein